MNTPLGVKVNARTWKPSQDRLRLHHLSQNAQPGANSRHPDHHDPVAITQSWPRRCPCACRKSNPDILMVQAAENWPRFDEPDGMDGSPDWRVLVQGEVSSALIVGHLEQ